MTTTIVKGIAKWGAVAALLGLLIWGPWRKPTIKIDNPTTTITRIVTSEPTVTIKTVEKIVTDPMQAATIKALLAENANLKLKVTQLTTTVAKLETTGGVGINLGTITQVDNVQRDNSEVRSYAFKDYQLQSDYTSDGKSFNYKLDQTFIINQTTGFDKQGKKLAIVEIFRQGPESKWIRVEGSTKEIFSDERAPRWYLSPRIAGGIEADANGKGGLVGLQWLSFGKSTAAEDQKYSVLSPAITSKGDLTLLPFSVNIGSLKHSPFTNLWVGPTVNLNKKVGVTVTARF